MHIHAHTTQYHITQYIKWWHIVNNYCHRKWNWQPVFKTWTSLFVFHFALNALEKVMNQFLLLPQLWVNSRVD